MKKLFITIAFVAATMFASAQLYVGGNLGMKITNSSLKSGSETQTQKKTFDLEIVPTVGYMFADNMGVGLDFGMKFNKETTPKEVIMATDDKIEKETSWVIAPYFRYVFAELDNFKFYADAKVAMTFGKEKIEQGSSKSDGDKTFNLGIGIIPGLSYDLTDNIAMVAEIDVLSLGYNMRKVTEPNDDVKKTNKFGLHVNNNADIKIGFVYNF